MKELCCQHDSDKTTVCSLSRKTVYSSQKQTVHKITSHDKKTFIQQARQKKFGHLVVYSTHVKMLSTTDKLFLSSVVTSLEVLRFLNKILCHSYLHIPYSSTIWPTVTRSPMIGKCDGVSVSLIVLSVTVYCRKTREPIKFVLA